MKLKYIMSEAIDKNCKATIHKSGALGFTKKAIEQLRLDINKSISIAVNADDESDNNLYMIVNSTIIEGAYTLKKAGSYYFANTRSLFDTLNINYNSDTTIMYDIKEIINEGEKIFKLIRREVKKNIRTKRVQ